MRVLLIAALMSWARKRLLALLLPPALHGLTASMYAHAVAERILVQLLRQHPGGLPRREAIEEVAARMKALGIESGANFEVVLQGIHESLRADWLSDLGIESLEASPLPLDGENGELWALRPPAGNPRSSLDP